MKLSFVTLAELPDRIGERIVRVCPLSMLIAGTVEQWRVDLVVVRRHPRRAVAVLARDARRIP